MTQASCVLPRLACASAEPGSKRAASHRERAFLAANGVFEKTPARAVLVTTQAACSLLQHYGASASVLAAMQGLQGAKPMTPAEISSLSPPRASQSGEDGSDEDDSEDELPLLSCFDRKSAMSPAVQQPGQAGCHAPHVPQAATLQHDHCLPTAALREASPAPEADGETAVLQKSAIRGSQDTALRHSTLARHGERAEWSHHSSDSEQHETATGGARRDKEVATDSKPTPVSSEKPSQHGHKACSSAGIKMLAQTGFRSSLYLWRCPADLERD